MFSLIFKPIDMQSYPTDQWQIHLDLIVPQIKKKINIFLCKYKNCIPKSDCISLQTQISCSTSKFWKRHYCIRLCRQVRQIIVDIDTKFICHTYKIQNTKYKIQNTIAKHLWTWKVYSRYCIYMGQKHIWSVSNSS